jgi:hypothetical protein
MFFIKKNLFILLGILLLVIISTVAFFGYYVSKQNTKNTEQAYQDGKEKVEEILQETNQSINKNYTLDNLNNLQNLTQDRNQETSSNDLDLEGTGMTVNKNTTIQQVIDIQKSILKSNYKFETFQYDNLEDYSNRVLDQDSFRFYSKFLTKVNTGGQTYNLGYGIKAIYDFEYQNQDYWFVITENLASQPSLYFISGDFKNSWEVNKNFGLDILVSTNRINNNEINFRLLNEQEKIVEQKVILSDIFMENKPF